jgi:serine protease
MGCDNIRVAVIDDGIDAHDEFTGRLLSGFTAGTNNTLGVPLNHSSKGHDVNCAGIIGAAHNNGEGIKGIAPNTLLIPVNIFPYTPTVGNQGGAALSSDIAAAIRWAWHPTLGNADVLSNSWGGSSPSTDITAEINNARTAVEMVRDLLCVCLRKRRCIFCKLSK